LTDAELTEERLIELLQPATDPPEPLRARGVGVAAARPKCTLYRRQMTRGIAVKPASEAVAMPIPFAFNSADLLPEATRRLDTVGRALSSGKLSSSCFRIEGHTDSVGSDDYNRRLSNMRAQSVVRYLAKNFGLNSERLLSEGFGEKRPIADNETDEGRSRNRRVQIVNLGYGEADP
jgi:outer membrane protein OmpA-like peptidoglycan-associated protein